MSVDAKTEEERNASFELGCVKQQIMRFIRKNGTKTITEQDIYSHFQTLASKLCIDIADKPSKKTTAETNEEQFIGTQIINARNFILQHKSKEIQEMYFIGDCVENILFTLCSSANSNDPEELPKLVQDLQGHAESRGVDIGDELSKINHHESLNEEDLKKLHSELKMKLCKGKRGEPKRSEIDSSRIITDEQWAISLVRLPDTCYNKHDFLVLEGKAVSKSMIWFIDFVANGNYNLFSCPWIRDGEVRMDHFESKGEVGSSSKLLFECHEKMMEIKQSDRLSHLTKPIPKATAQKLIRNIQTQQNNSPKYNILANCSNMLPGSSAITSSYPNGHNDFTFVRMVLRDLNYEDIKMLQDSLGDQRWDSSIFTLTLTFLAGVVFAYTYL
jgi:hypothetical protein